MIIFSEEGVLMNGQHRLEAIIGAGRGMWAVVAKGVPADQVFVMDQGTGRRFRENYNLLTGRSIQNRTCTTGMYFYRTPFMPAEGLMTLQEQKALMDDHADTLEWVDNCFGQSNVKGITIGPVVGVVARAYESLRLYSQGKKRQRDRLAEFASVMVTGESNGPADQAGIRLRNWLVKRSMENAPGGLKSAAEVYCRTEFALAAFMAGQPIKKLRKVQDEIYPIANSG
jgi:hypothetical protein